jgi:hypothetical protein
MSWSRESVAKTAWICEFHGVNEDDQEGRLCGPDEGGDVRQNCQ